MPIERGGIPQRFEQPKFQTFDAGTGGAAGGKRELQQQQHLDRPLDLAGNIRTAVEQARATWKVDADFNPAGWLRDELKHMANDTYFDSRATGIFELPPELRERQKEKEEFLYGLRVAWSLVAYEQLDGENSGSIYNDIRTFTDIHDTSSVTLSPLGVTFLDAMAEAIGIPDHTPGQATFNIYPFSGEAAEGKIRRNAASLIPAREEVNRGVSSKNVDELDAEQ